MIKINRSIDQVIYHLGIENVFVDEKVYFGRRHNKSLM